MSRLKLKREDCKRTHHDSVFSKWEILIGSSDWEDYSLGKDGIQRYRLHNLPNGTSCPGLYELGIAAVPTDVGRKSRRHDSQNIIVVYLGQTNNVRTRLQRYGRVGAHLDSGKLVSSVNENECSGLFKEVFCRGYSIMFRWAPMIDKKKAVKTESELLAVFDYAWNKCGNGACRRDEILSKLDSKAATQVSTILRKLQPWKHPAFGRRAGINIDASVPLDYQKSLLLPFVFKFGKSQLQFVHGNSSLYEDHKICGVSIGNGFVCENRPILGRKRCEEHKGKKIIGAGSVLSRVTAITENTTTCGVVLEDGFFCAEVPAYGRKRCELHEGKRITKFQLHDMPVGPLEVFDHKEIPLGKCQLQSVKGVDKYEEEYNICGVVYVDGTMCRNKPVLGRKRCVEHKGQKATVIKLKLPTSRECWETIEDGVICGVVTDGYICRKKPVLGRKRCEEHRGRRITVMLPGMSSEGLEEKTDVSVCGVGLGDGSRCGRLPVPGRKRCELHKGRRVT